jgi:hypothetical protein
MYRDATIDAMKRTVAVSVTMSEQDLKKLESASQKRWPGAIMSRSSKVLALALLGAESIQPEPPKKKS